MAIQFCTCPAGRENLGVLSCASTMKTVKKHIFMAQFANDGTRNSIKLADLVDGVLPDSFVLDKVNESDKSKRWYFTPDKYENVAPSRTDPVTEDFNSGRIEKIQDGVMQFEGFLVGQDSTLASKLASNGCGPTAAFEVGKDGSIRGEVSADGTELYPLLVNKGSLVSVPVPEVEGSSVAKIQLNFQYDELVNEAKLMILQKAQMATDLLKVQGLLDGSITVLSSPAITNSTVSITLDYTNYGSFGVQNAIQGQDVEANWELLDGVTPVTISDVNDVNGDGTQYDFTFTSTPTTDLTLNYIGTPAASTDQGFDIPSVNFTTPA